jgi:HAD superfamily hydrolase (TIGR01662 family)
MKEVHLILGPPASGKTSLVKDVAGDCVRLNRDTCGGTMNGLLKIFEQEVIKDKNIVLDNLFPTIESRKPFIEIAKKNGATVICHWVTTSIEDSAFNACKRMIDKYGKILYPTELKKAKDPNTFPPAVLFKYKKEFEKPGSDEGFRVEKYPFVRKFGPEYINKALLLDYDGTLRKTKSGEKFPCDPKDLYILPGRKEKLKEYINKGYRLLGVSNQSGIAKGQLTEDMARKCFDATNDLLGIDIEYSFCPHSVPPISCYCRKPMQGHDVQFIEKYKLNPSECIMVGDMTSDKTFAARCGFKFIHAGEFFI